MAKCTVILRRVGYFFGDNEDSTVLFHVDAATIKGAVVAAQADLIATWEFDANDIEREGGADKVMPALHVFAGHLQDLSDQVSREAAVMAAWRAGDIISDIREVVSNADNVISAGGLENLSWRRVSIGVDHLKLIHPVAEKLIGSEIITNDDPHWEMARSQISGAGNILASIEQSPILVELTDDASVCILDGIYLLILAIFEHDLLEIPMLVGAEEKTLERLLYATQ